MTEKPEVPISKDIIQHPNVWRAAGAYVLIGMTALLVMAISGAFQIDASEKNDIRRAADNARVIRASQLEGCQRNNNVREELRETKQIQINDPDTNLSDQRDLRTSLDALGPVNCVEKYPPLRK